MNNIARAWETNIDDRVPFLKWLARLYGRNILRTIEQFIEGGTKHEPDKTDKP